MKKILVFLLALVLIGPTIGLACDCCPSQPSAPSESPTLGFLQECCLMIDVDRERCDMERTEKPLLASSRIAFLSPPSVQAASEGLGHPDFTGPPLLGPPLFSSTPLYLIHQVLRI